MEPILCANGCGFFGSGETQNMCSKCYKDLIKNQSISAKPISAVDREENTDVKVELPRKKFRCKKCNKKVGLLGFKCRCGGVFCGQDRMPELHACDFDHKTTKSHNPHVQQIKSDKLEHRL